MFERFGNWRSLQWVIVPLAIVLLAEAVAQVGLQRHQEWYDGSSTDGADVFIIGSSRVASGFDAGVVAAELNSRTGSLLNITNQGRGGSTIVEHMFALRSAIESRDSTEPFVVALELVGGVPAPLMRTTWQDRWFEPDFPSLLARTMRWSDLGDFLSADHSRSEVFAITSRLAFDRSSFVGFKDGWRDLFFDQGANRTTDVLARVSSRARDDRVADIRTDGGVGADAARLEDARALAIERASEAQAADGVVVDWNDSVLGDLVAMVQDAGGQMLFFEMPVSSIFEGGFEADVHLVNEGQFAEAAKAWDTPILDLALDFPDDAYPDLWHLGTSGARETSAAFGGAFPVELLRSR